MAKPKMSEDEIKWILSVESAEAQQKIHQLTKANKDLYDENKRRLAQMEKLSAQGRKDSQEYKGHSRIVAENTAAISHNKEMISQLTAKMKTSELTMSQLRKQARDLQRQLESTARGTHPEQYAALEKQLKETKDSSSAKPYQEGVGSCWFRFLSTFFICGLE